MVSGGDPFRLLGFTIKINQHPDVYTISENNTLLAQLRYHYYVHRSEIERLRSMGPSLI